MATAYDTIRYEMLFYFLGLYNTQNQQLKSGKTEKLKSKKRVCSAVSVSVCGVGSEEEKKDYGGKDLWKMKVLSVE